jgi:magnesium transporter
LTVLLYRDGVVHEAEAVDPAWLEPGSGVVVWADIQSPTADDRKVLSDVFRFHELAVEDSVLEVHHPKIETYGNMLYLILHGIVAGKKHQGFETRDIDFFLGPGYLVTVHHYPSRSVAAEGEVL